ncbi:MAG TPA: hypothetical protein VMZ28_17865 [Kofleriaceae bacterium]|nr:hypothetical protein [Kofleriaceae bacterium]
MLRPDSDAAPPRFALTLLVTALAMALPGCGPMPARLRFVSSQATHASWSFVVDDRARGAQMLIDGRFRYTGCDRAGRNLRCELRGMFPGGHTVELRLPGAVLRRSVVIGREWPTRPALVRVGSPDEAKAAAKAGADGVIAENSLGPETLGEIAEAVHAESARLFVSGDATAIETAGADGVIDAALPADMKRRFPEAQALAIDAAASKLLLQVDKGTPLPAPAPIHAAAGLVEGRGLYAGALALLGPAGAVVDKSAFPMLGARKRHAALRAGAATLLTALPTRVAFTVSKGGDHVTVLVNADAEPWPVRPAQPANPLDLLGGQVHDGEATVAPNDVALLVSSPQPDRTRF